MPKPMTPAESKEYDRLYGEWRNAVNHGGEILAKFGGDSKEFAEADAATGRIWTAMRVLRGDQNAHWAS